MRTCPECNEKKKWKEFSGMGSCRECNKKRCSICGSIFCPTGKKTHCSNRCNLLGNIKKTAFGCWEWQKGKVAGYGRIRDCETKKLILAHRLSYKIFKGDLSDDLFVCHQCDNPSCINPDHLFLGTNIENCQDSIKKGRQFPIRSVAHLRGKKVSHGGKLGEKEVKEIRMLRQKGMARKQIAEKFDVTPEHIWQIVTGKRWGHI